MHFSTHLQFSRTSFGAPPWWLSASERISSSEVRLAFVMAW